MPPWLQSSVNEVQQPSLAQPLASKRDVDATRDLSPAAHMTCINTAGAPIRIFAPYCERVCADQIKVSIDGDSCHGKMCNMQIRAILLTRCKDFTLGRDTTTGSSQSIHITLQESEQWSVTYGSPKKRYH